MFDFFSMAVLRLVLAFVKKTRRDSRAAIVNYVMLLRDTVLVVWQVIVMCSHQSIGILHK